jgi:hypothetical protein
VGFFDVIVLPLYRAFVDVFPEAKPLLDQAEHNRTHWSRQAALEPKEDGSKDIVKTAKSARVLRTPKDSAPSGTTFRGQLRGITWKRAATMISGRSTSGTVGRKSSASGCPDDEADHDDDTALI